MAAVILMAPKVSAEVLRDHPDEAATAAIRMAEQFVPWLEGVAAGKYAATGAAATAAPAIPGTGDADDSTRAGPEEV